MAVGQVASGLHQFGLMPIDGADGLMKPGSDLGVGELGDDDEVLLQAAKAASEADKSGSFSLPDVDRFVTDAGQLVLNLIDQCHGLPL